MGSMIEELTVKTPVNSPHSYVLFQSTGLALDLCESGCCFSTEGLIKAVEPLADKAALQLRQHINFM